MSDLLLVIDGNSLVHRAFHAMALDMGPMGLDTLRERLVDGAGG